MHFANYSFESRLAYIVSFLLKLWHLSCHTKVLRKIAKQRTTYPLASSFHPITNSSFAWGSIKFEYHHRMFDTLTNLLDHVIHNVHGMGF